ncbi:asparagine synthase (glutamine-hydrolyzing) [Shouchella shacheensis]|uniref:asparagine synthase (glutamine-hydrolyzing) n=1 Tax=Shouchella shacheensis TaxID=1649580 RepID=UPI00074005FB|nr:asparagine synthase (glutamine-hydrolyzing) [Shouchella shacheensis]
MCGFIGELLHDANNHVSEEQWSEALEAIHHRGPDSTGNYQDSFVRLGFKRLSIIDLEHGHQPLSYENGRYHIIFNGELYNYVELKAELIERGYTFQTDSDTEVLLALYAFEGKKSVKKLRGMFAFAIWDSEKGELFCARDPFGIKPFYYVKDRERFFFASELKSINPVLAKQSIVQESLQHYTTFQFVPEPRALTKNVHKLLPGHTLTISKQLNEKIERFSARSFEPQAGASPSELAAKTQQLLRDSVAKHMRSDVPVGAFLSSGIDSTSIVALAKELHPNLKTFTVGFGNEGFSEIDIAKDTANQLGVENISKVISPEEFMQELPNIIWHMDEPVADPAAVPLYFVAKEASKHVKVVLSGEGADELFGGYNIYREPLDLAWFKRIPNGLRKPLNGLFKQLPGAVKGRNYLIRGTTPIEQRYIGNAFIFSEAEKTQLFKSYDSSKPYTKVTEPFYRQITNYDDSTKMQYIDMHTWLSGDILVKADRMTMAHSLELRVPFLDKEVFALARTIERDAKLQNKTTKYVLRQAMKEYIPSTIVPRKKLGFPVPIRLWLKNEMYDWAKTLITTSPASSQFFRQEFLLKLLEDHAAGRADNSRKLWTVLCFILWHQVHVEKSLRSPNQLINAERLSEETREARVVV